MGKMILACAIFAALAGSYAQAEDKKPDNEVSFNASLVSDYRYRGISQTRLDPALQGGVDYTNNPTGLYAGTWLSTIKWIKDTPGAGSTPAEWDIYGGKKGEITKGVTYDVGGLWYVYLNNKLQNATCQCYANANTFELYGQIGYGPAYIKYSHSLTNLFGNPDSHNSGYLDIGANVDVAEGLTVNLHAGRQRIKGINDPVASYTDWKVGLTKDFGVVTGSVAAVGTNADEVFYASPANGKFMGKKALVLSVGKTF
ncbi:MAG TPA: TorF family putative porin [Noviherbaspirillum sp.]